MTYECCLPHIAFLQSCKHLFCKHLARWAFSSVSNQSLNWSLVSHEILNVHLPSIIHNFSSSIISANFSWYTWGETERVKIKKWWLVVVTLSCLQYSYVTCLATENKFALMLHYVEGYPRRITITINFATHNNIP